MGHIRGKGHHRTTASHSPVRALVVVLVIVAVLVGGGWLVVRHMQAAAPVAKPDKAATVTRVDLDNKQAVPEPVVEHHGNSPDCPDTDCISMLVNGDLLFHPNLWKHFAGANTAATDGTAFDFTPLFETMKPYIQASDIAVCEFETPIAKRGGPYTGYPVFNVPPEVADAAASVGYTACTHATNHSWDQGADGIARLWDTLASKGIAQAGSYKTEEDSTKPLVIDSPTGGGKLGLVTGTVSLNGMTADHDWQVDRLREAGDPQHQSDIDRAVAKAKAAREQGADVVAMAMHSVQEYIDYADSWQVSEAHELADTGAFDVIYGAGCHCAQPIENYNGTWIIYGLGNTVTVSAPASRIVNNQGVTARIQFAGRKGVAGAWRVSRIDWVPTANMRQGSYQWCPISSDHPNGTCWSESQDAQVRQRIWNVIYSMGADKNVVKEWNITDENRS
ncbi:CapA family protein [Bifidobacterium bifidum]|uniref:CapA family protein n=1 Tax=Bifidobacterium bifidum TaxID=1681 RepID=UPI00101EE281|nr:CapA family protein [Bifidobacterium bifidum]KAB5610774.1 CapA family protein [Bifidobacterium bifidum]KAB5612915.1 CapA family protein [Bifidobacterium bifidum]KAB5616709.1 CapA family protein [Bifidobacterium bifidum]KAB5618925.1 CapA family protein [Bifidobacterium bifidum]KAB5622230.1 CapA family protein [Bifidobacterium bifidum]